jgi:hypothetical protein
VKSKKEPARREKQKPVQNLGGFKVSVATTEQSIQNEMSQWYGATVTEIGNGETVGVIYDVSVNEGEEWMASGAERNALLNHLAKLRSDAAKFLPTGSKIEFSHAESYGDPSHKGKALDSWACVITAPLGNGMDVTGRSGNCDSPSEACSVALDEARCDLYLSGWKFKTNADAVAQRVA